jgi:hypothetical protein
MSSVSNSRGKVGNHLIAGIVPDSESLSLVLSKVLNENGFVEGKINILEREPNIYISTFPSEIVTCLLQDGRNVKIFCKYGSDRFYDSRGDIYYESQVYQNVLRPLHVSSPAFYGLHYDEKGHSKWLFLEYIDQASRLSKIEGADAMIHAANWLGRFHAATEAHLPKTSKKLLLRYNEDYYLGCIRQLLLVTGQSHHRFKWLPMLCERADQMAALLRTKKPTVIHGEYYPRNILYQHGVVRPVDWQTAAIAAGEIDLASLTEGWSPEIVYDCEREYQRTRWPEHVPEDFCRILGAARLYLQFRYLGSHQEWKKGNMPWRFERLKTEGERLGLI